MATSTDARALQSLEPDPLEPSAEEVGRYVSTLQDLAATDPALARRQAWNQIRLAGARATAHRAEAHDSLNRIFRLGTPPEPGLEGPHQGILVTTTIWSAVDPLFRALAAAWMPWLGKRFHGKSEAGDNLLVKNARIPVKLLWPGYELQDSGQGGYAAFRFRTYTAPGKVDPDRQTLKIDYDSDENPGLLIRDILDELVQVVPGAYLGKVLLRRGSGEQQSWRLIGYFGLLGAETAAGEQPAPGALEGEPVPAPA